MQQILLTKNQVALVDDEDFEKLSKFKWYASKTKCGYMAMRACRCVFVKKQYKILMHRQIINCPIGMKIDHRDHNELNNQKFNIRICTNAENVRNGSKHKNNTSGYKGVFWHKKTQKWQAAIRFNYKLIHLGLFDSAIEAAQVYDYKARELFGEFALTNF